MNKILNRHSNNYNLGIIHYTANITSTINNTTGSGNSIGKGYRIVRGNGVPTIIWDEVIVTAKNKNNWIKSIRNYWNSRNGNIDHFLLMANPIVRAVHAGHESAMRNGFTVTEYLGEGLFWGGTFSGCVPVATLGKNISAFGAYGNTLLDIRNGNARHGIGKAVFSSIFGFISSKSTRVEGAELIMPAVTTLFDYGVQTGVDRAYDMSY